MSEAICSSDLACLYSKITTQHNTLVEGLSPAYGWTVAIAAQRPQSSTHKIFCFLLGSWHNSTSYNGIYYNWQASYLADHPFTALLEAIAAKYAVNSSQTSFT